MKFTKRDIELLRQRDDYLGEDFDPAEEEKDLNENIQYWNELIHQDLSKMKLGVYCLAYQLTRQGLQFYLENLSKTSAKILEDAIQETDNYFKSKMLPKEHDYLGFDIEELKEDSYFWMTHSIHPIDLAKGFEVDKIHLQALEVLRQEEAYMNAMKLLFENKTEQKTLFDYREYQCVDPHQELIECFKYLLWRNEKTVQTYLAELLEGKVQKLTKKRTIELDKKMIALTFAKWIDEGNVDKEDLQRLDLILERQLYYLNGELNQNPKNLPYRFDILLELNKQLLSNR